MTTNNIRKILLPQYYLQVCLAVILFLCPEVSSQIDIEAVSRLHFKIKSQPDQWFEGFNSVKSGSFSPYQSHRSGMNRDSAYVVRTSGSEDLIEWSTSTISASFKGDSVYFLWACGFGNNLGNEWFDLFIDGDSTVSFLTKNDNYWSIAGKKGIKLSFTSVYQNSNKANFGYMVLSLPKSYFSERRSLNVSIRGRSSEKEIWYRLFAYKDALKYALENEHKKIFSNIDFIHMGDAKLTLCASAKKTNSLIQLYNSDILIGEGRLKSDGVISKLNIFIPRYLQYDNNINTIISLDGEAVDTINWNEINTWRIHAFMDEEIECDRYVFKPGEFPAFRWKNEILVENELGIFPLNVIYYNNDFQKVTAADKPGRYGAVIEGITPNKFVIKRFVTLFCSDVEFDDYSKDVPIKINNLKEFGIDDDKWNLYQNNEERYSFGSLKLFPLQSADAAIFLAGLNDLEIDDRINDSPRIRDRQWWITLKGKLEGKSILQNPLVTPKITNNDSPPLLKDSNQLSSIYDKEKIKKIKSLCLDWALKGEVPNVTLIVHKGKIIFYDAFGLDKDSNPIGKESTIWMASITKLLTGVLMMQFVDQGLVDLDASVGVYLPELRGIANDKLTVRHLFNHTSGLEFAGEWASDWNVALENQIAQILPFVDIGKSFSYHRVGYALAGKIIERITGKAVPYLFHEYIFSPLGMHTAYSDNTYGGLYCSSIDLARFGQMLLNKGAYNGYLLFSQQTFEKMLPQKLVIGDRIWGIGTSTVEGNGLSEKAFGHGAASGTVFIIDPKKDLIIISSRNKPGKSHDEFESALIKLCTSLVNNH